MDGCEYEIVGLGFDLQLAGTFGRIDVGEKEGGRRDDE
jgi:hypothetical protein